MFYVCGNYSIISERNSKSSWKSKCYMFTLSWKLSMERNKVKSAQKDWQKLHQNNKFLALHIFFISEKEVDKEVK